MIIGAKEIINNGWMKELRRISWEEVQSLKKSLVFLYFPH